TYYTIMTVGNISFRAAIDTGSADFWLLSTGCTDNACNNLPKYPLLYDSPSFTAVNGNSTQFNASFADTTRVSGFVARETVQLASLSVSQQAFGLANTSNVTLVDDVSGVLGLGFPRLSTIHSLAMNATPVFTTLAQQGSLVYPVFGVGLTRSAPWGSLTLGAVDSTFVKNASLIGWNEVLPFEPFVGSTGNASSYLQWAITMSNITVGNQSIQPIPSYPQANRNKSIALIDVGTEGIFGPYQDVERIFSNVDTSRLVDDSGQWAIPCDTQATITFAFGDQNYTLLPSDFLIGPVSTNPSLCLSWPKASAPTGDGIDWQLGSAFLRTVYTIFGYGIANKEPPVIGFYPLQPSNATSPLQPLAQQSLSALFSSLSLTVATTLPNSLLSTPTPTVPSYIFNTSVATSSPVQSDLAASTYAPIFRSGRLADITDLPELVPGQVTITSDGVVITSTVLPPTQSASLGSYPGQPSGALTTRATWPIAAIVLSVVACIVRLF
ncbi:aspartic peptidase domain-containing protein, partial [Vararia minispora EC-137]